MGKNNKKKNMYTRKEEESGKKTVLVIGLVALLLAIGIIAVAALVG